MSVETVDVIIVGAGPAGASAALELERRRVNCLLLDRAGFPRDKPCAGILPPKISELVGPLPDGVFERKIGGYLLHTASGLTFRSRFSRTGYSVDRSKFDAWLVSKLKSAPRRATFLREEEEAGRIRVSTAEADAHCRVLIGADGVNSRVRAGISVPPGRMAAAIQATLPMSTSDIKGRTKDWFHVFYLVPGGYGWVAPHFEVLKAGIGSILPKHAGQEALLRFLSHPDVRELTGGTEVSHLEAHRIPMSGPSSKVGQGRVLLAGDAGGFVFPGTGEGIRFAMESGICAARTAAEAVRQGFSGPMLQRAYKRRLSEEGLLSLREVDYQSVLRTPESAEGYVKGLISLSRRASSS